MRPEPLYRILARTVDARLRCAKDADKGEWVDRHTERIRKLVRTQLPSGSGFDNGTSIDLKRSTGERLVFTTAFHHMGEDGYYSGWTEHEVIVTGSLAFGFSLRVTGRDRKGIKDYVADEFEYQLSTEIDEQEHPAETVARETAAKESRVERLRQQGFDQSEAVPFERRWRVRCSQCEAFCINGVPCHETGCPNEPRGGEEYEDG